jgi:hypothetical protein
MKLSLRAITLILLLLAAAATASADTLTLTNGGSYSMGGVMVGPYNFTGTIGGQNVSLQLICDSFQNEVTSGESWNVHTYTLPTLPGPPNSPQGTLAQYQEVAYLSEMMFALNPASPGYSTTLGELQWADWNIFDPGVGLSSANPDPYGSLTAAEITAIQGFVTMAQNNAGSGDYSNLTIYSPDPGTQQPNPPNTGLPQEYLGITPTPEPGTLLLFGTGLFGLTVFRRRFSN